MSLESRISKTVVDYIDTAITAPPIHQPLQDADKVYDSFVMDFAHLSAGIDMKQSYQRKPLDPPYLPSFDNDAINLARLFLAFRAREQVPLALRPRPEPPLSLDSVDLAKVTERTLERVLFSIANANERASASKRLGNDPIFTRAYEVFKLVAPLIAALPSYVRSSDDPHWMVRYSDQAIKTVQALLAIQARLGSGSEMATPSGPMPVPSLNSVIMKDVTHQQFLDTLNGALQMARASRLGDHAPAPTDSTDIESGSNTGYEPEGEDQDDWDTESAGEEEDEVETEDSDAYDEDHDVSFDGDISTDEEDIEIIPQAVLTEDLEGEIVFETEEDYQMAFKEWNDNEADEPLLQDVIEVLGMAKAPIAEMKKNIQIVLRELRRLYRIAHTAPWRYSSEPHYERTITPFVYCYSVLSDTVFFMRSFPLIAFHGPDDPEMVHDMKAGLGSLRKSLRKIPGTLEGLPDCQKIMTERARITRVRLNAYFDALTCVAEIQIKHEKAFTVTGPRHMPEINVNYHNGIDLNIAVQHFKASDSSRLGMEYFPEFPGSLIKGCKILYFLDQVYGLKFIAEFRKSEEIKKAANTAGELLRKWHQRSRQTHNSLFVALQ